MLDERSESIDEPNVNSVMAMVLIGPSIVRPVGRKWTMSQSDDEDEASEPQAKELIALATSSWPSSASATEGSTV